MENTTEKQPIVSPEVKEVKKAKEAPAVVLTKEEKIVEFVKSRNSNDYVKINDFLKSLFPVPKNNEPAGWANQRASKDLKHLLGKMQDGRQLEILNDSHKQLGQVYYEGDQQYQKHHNISTVELWAKI